MTLLVSFASKVHHHHHLVLTMIYIIFQVSMTSVQVSWSGLVTRSECADQYIVKSWLARNPNDYQMSDLLPTTQLSFIVTDLVPNQDYVFQVIFVKKYATLKCSTSKGQKISYLFTRAEQCCWMSLNTGAQLYNMIQTICLFVVFM